MRSNATAFLRNLIIERPRERRGQGIAGQLARQGVGTPQAGNVIYGAADFAQAEEILRGMGIDGPIGLGSAHQSRPSPAAQAQPRSAQIEHLDPRLCAWRALGSSHPAPGPAVSFAASPWPELLSLQAQKILVCERLEVLSRLDEFRWLPPFWPHQQVLAVFTGHSAMFPKSAVEGLLLASSAPVLYLGDFAPQSLHAASKMPRLQAFCLPSRESLLGALMTQRPTAWFRRNSRLLAPQLDACTHPSVAAAWNIMKVAGRSLSLGQFPL